MSGFQVDGVYVPAPLCSTVRRLLESGIRTASERDGRSVPAVVSDLVESLRRKAADFEGVSSAALGSVPAGAAAIMQAVGQEIDTTEAGMLLRVKERRVRDLCASGRLSARRVGVSWLIDRSSVLAHRAERGE